MATGSDEGLTPLAGLGGTPLLIPAGRVASMMGVSERTLWRLLSAGRMPEPVRIGHSTRWRLADIADWIARGCPTRP